MEDRGNVGLAPSRHDGTPIASIARINDPVANGPVSPRLEVARAKRPHNLPSGKFAACNFPSFRGLFVMSDFT